MAVKLGNGNWAVKEDKLLAYNDNSGLFFNKEFDFSRGTSATYVAKDGLIKTAGIQPNIVNNGDFSELGSELVTNGSFENWTADNPDSWTVVNEDANNYVTQDGTYARIVSNDTASIQIKQTIFTIGKIYKVELDAVVNSGNVEGLKLNDATAAATIGYVNSTGHHTFYFKAAGTAFVINRKGGGDTDILIDNVSVKQVDPNDYWTLGTDWTVGDSKVIGDNSDTESEQQIFPDNTSRTLRIRYTLTVDSGQVAVYMSGQEKEWKTASGTYTDIITTTSKSIEFDGRNSDPFSGTITDIIVQEIQTDTPRIDFTNDTKGHLLLEPQSTNLVTYSEDFSQWTRNTTNIDTPSNVTQTNPSGESESGFININNGVSATKFIYKSISTTSSIHTQSVFFKYHSRQWIQLLSGGTSHYANFDIQNGVVGNVLDCTATIEDYGSGWYKCTATLSSAGTPINMVIAVLDDDATSRLPNSTGTGSYYVWGTQVEALSYATSYIPTTGATSTRNADVCNNSGSAQDFNSEEGVLYAEIAYLSDTGTYRTISINDGSNDNMVAFENRPVSNQIKAFINVSGVSVMSSTQSLTNVKQFNKIAIKWKQDDFAWWVNGVQIHEDLSGSTFASGVLNKLNFNNGIENFPFEGKVRNVQVFTEALTDEQLEKLTS